MAQVNTRPTNHARTFGENEIIVSKTNLKGHITYANDVFLRIAGYSEQVGFRAFADPASVFQPHEVCAVRR